MKNFIDKSSLSFLLLVSTDFCHAQFLSNLVKRIPNNRFLASVFIAQTDVSYETINSSPNSSSDRIEVESEAIGVAFGYGIDRKFDFYGQLVRELNSDFSSASLSCDGDGYQYALGGRYEMFRKKKNLLIAGFEYGKGTSEWRCGSIAEFESEGTQAYLGAAYGYRLNRELMPFSSLQIGLIREGKSTEKNTNTSVDIEKENALDFSVGLLGSAGFAEYALEIKIMAEQSLIVSAHMPI